MIAKFKVGDKVRLCEDWKSVHTLSSVTRHLKQFEGKILTVSEVIFDGTTMYKFEEDNTLVHHNRFRYLEARFELWEEPFQLSKELFII